MIIYTVLLFVLAVLAIVGLVQWGRARVDKEIKRLRLELAQSNQDLLESRKMNHKAECTLRSIANGAGNPVLEAQIALDDFNNYHEKELS